MIKKEELEELIAQSFVSVAYKLQKFDFTLMRVSQAIEGCSNQHPRPGDFARLEPYDHTQREYREGFRGIL